MATFIQWHFQPVEPKKDAIASHMRTIMGGDFHTVEQLEKSKGVETIYNKLKEIKKYQKQHIPANVFTFITKFCEAYKEKNMKKWKNLWSKWHHDHPFADFMIQKLGLMTSKKFGEFSEVKSFEKLLNELRKKPQIGKKEKAAKEKAAREKAAREKAAKAKLKAVAKLKTAQRHAAEKAAKEKANLKTVVAGHHKAAKEKAAKTKHNTHSGLWDKIKAHGGLWHKIKATFNKCDATKGHTTLNQDRFENYTKFLIVDSIMDTKSLFDILKRQNDNIKIDDLVGYLEILWTKYKGDLNRMVRYGDDPQVLMVQMTRAVIRMVMVE